jgi:hypothetical protein
LVLWKSSLFSASTLPSLPKPKPRERGLPNHCGYLVIVDLVGFKKHSQWLETTNSMELASFLMFGQPKPTLKNATASVTELCCRTNQFASGTFELVMSNHQPPANFSITELPFRFQ